MPFRAEYPFIALDIATDDVLRPCLDVVLRGRDWEIGSPTPELVDRRRRSVGLPGGLR
jgi:hypothetical protein